MFCVPIRSEGDKVKRDLSWKLLPVLTFQLFLSWLQGKDGGPIVNLIGRALIPVVAVDQPEESSAGQEPSPSPVPLEDEYIMESTIM